MSKTKSFLIPAMAAAVFATAIPAAASAQPYHRAPAVRAVAADGIIERKINLEHRVDRAMARRQLTAREGRQLKRDLAVLDRQIRQDLRGGLQRREREQLNRRLNQIEQRLHREVRDIDRRH